MKKNIPYKYYKFALVLVWALAILGIVATWVGFCCPGTASLVFAGLVDSFLVLAIIWLVVMLFLSGRENYNKRAIAFIVAGAAHFVFFICCFAVKDSLTDNAGLYALPAIHTLILLGITGVGIYFWIRNKFTFKSIQEEDAHAAFGGPIEDESKKYEPLQPEEPKKARDEKTGIVSL